MERMLVSGVPANKQTNNIYGFSNAKSQNCAAWLVSSNLISDTLEMPRISRLKMTAKPQLLKPSVHYSCKPETRPTLIDGYSCVSNSAQLARPCAHTASNIYRSEITHCKSTKSKPNSTCSWRINPFHPILYPIFSLFLVTDICCRYWQQQQQQQWQ